MGNSLTRPKRVRSCMHGVRFGVALAEELGADSVPACYESIIRRAAGL